MKTVYLSLGSNVGDRADTIARAVEALNAHGVRVTKRSALYETEPVNVRGGGWFLNAAVEAQTELTPQGLIQTLLEVERSLGRVRAAQAETGAAAKAQAGQSLKEPRTIDLDILLFGETAVDAPGLTIPHPRMSERKFVLAPLAEIAPLARHPILQKTIAELLAATSDRSQVRPWPENQRK